MYILVIGTPIKGYEFEGIFGTEAEAIEYGDRIHTNIEWWTAQLVISNKPITKPKIVKSEDAPINAICSCGHPWAQHTQNVHGTWVCSQCNCRNMNRPSENPK